MRHDHTAATIGDHAITSPWTNRRQRWTRIELPSGGYAKVSTDASAKDIQALDKLMQAVMARHLEDSAEDDDTP